jgi:hypothetical protein
VTSGETATVRTYTAPDDGLLVTSHVIELPAQRVVVDTQYALPCAREIVDDAKGGPDVWIRVDVEAILDPGQAN